MVKARGAWGPAPSDCTKRGLQLRAQLENLLSRSSSSRGRVPMRGCDSRFSGIAATPNWGLAMIEFCRGMHDSSSRCTMMAAMAPTQPMAGRSRLRRVGTG